MVYDSAETIVYLKKMILAIIAVFEVERDLGKKRLALAGSIASAAILGAVAGLLFPFYLLTMVLTAVIAKLF
ncbi:hypothetical protein [Ferrovum sp.]|uniref:hypothetical protein n=1 Tax=Ferrovum sp. TaxID=2609467 RepID=UPI0026360FF6|nr:hypothetical protein [Ferrovum sp.]